jgi:hypothetical protein
MIEFFINAPQQSRPDSPGAGCSYRLNGAASDPICCAVGYLMPDDFWRPYLNDEAVGDLIQQPRSADHPFVEFLKQYRNVLTTYQIYHDSPHAWDDKGFITLNKVLATARIHMDIQLTAEEIENYNLRLHAARSTRVVEDDES